MAAKINPFRQVIEAFKGFNNTDSLYRLCRQSVGRKMLFSLIVAAIVSFIMFFVSGMMLSSDLGEVIGKIDRITYADGKLFCGNGYEGKVGNYYLVVDTDVDVWKNPANSALNLNYYGTDVSDRLDNELMYRNDFKDIIMVSKSNIVCLLPVGLRYAFMEYKWKDITDIAGISTFSEVQIKSTYIIIILLVSVVIFLLEIPVQIFKLFLAALLWSVLGIIINAVKKSDESFATIYWASFYMQAVFMICTAVLQTFFAYPSYALLDIKWILYILMQNRLLRIGVPPDMRKVSYGEDFMRYVETGGKSYD